MPEQTVVATPTPVTTTPVTTTQVATPVVTTEKAPEVDVIAKVTQFAKSQEKAMDNITNAPEQPEFATITDPVAREQAKQAVERMRRGMQSDYTRKIEEANRLIEQSKSWTPQRIQQELNNPEFIQAAQLVAGSQSVNQNDRPLTQEEYSTLTDNEKARLAIVPKLESKIAQMEQNNIQQMIRTRIAQKDAILSARYADYNPTEVDTAINNLSRLSPDEIREHAYRVLNYEKHIKSAVEYGKAEARGLNQQKLDVLSPQGISATNNEGVPTKMKGESDQALFVRIAQFRLAQHRKR